MRTLAEATLALAAPLAGRYAQWLERHPRETAPLEGAPTEVTRTRASV